MNYLKTFNLLKNKQFEIQFSVDDDSTVFNIGIDWNRKCDHAGINIVFAIYKYYLFISFVDIRHWNEKENRWMKEGEHE